MKTKNNVIQNEEGLIWLRLKQFLKLSKAIPHPTTVN
jgi:hypothetical protein